MGVEQNDLGEGRQALKQAGAHGDGFCSVAWCQIEGGEGSRPVWHAVTAGQDGKLVLREGNEGLGVVKISGDQEKAVHALAVTPDGRTVATVDDQYVQLYCTPDMELQTSACRFTLPGRAIDIGGRGGGVLAAGGDDGLLKLVTISDTKVFRQIKTDAYIRGVSLDPEGTYVAASTADGHLRVWDLADGKQEMNRHVCPKVATDSTRRSAVAWSPDGGALLAAPGRDNDAVLLERLSWKAAQYLSGVHTAEVNTLAFSPNGVYLATGGLDKQVVVWLAEKGVAVAKTTLEEVPSSLAWHPRGDALLIAGEGGGVGAWPGAVPGGRGLPSPWRSQDDVLRHADAAAAAGASTAGGTTMDEGPEDSLAGGAGAASGRLRKRGGGGAAASAGGSLEELDDDFEDSEGNLGFARAKRQRQAAAAGAGAAGGLLRPGAAATALMAAPAPRLPKAQAAVQPGSTPEGEGGARFLAYTSLGCVISRKVDSHRTCEVLFHDASRGRAKLPLLTDYYGFTLAALGDAGVAYASPASADAPPMVMYRPFDCWAANSDWSVQLPRDEAPCCLAAGQSFVAVATSAQLLRIYSPAGRQLAAISLPGAPAALAAEGHNLLAAHQAANPCWDATAGTGTGSSGTGGTQRLGMVWFDVARQSQAAACALPLSRGASLAWLGLSEEGLPAALDTAGVLRVRGHDWGGAWVPVFDSKLARAEGTSEAFWPVAVTCRELTCVVTSDDAPHPPVNPRPVLSIRPLQVPPAAAEGAPAELEDEAMRLGVRTAHLRAAAAAAAESGDAEEAARCAEELEAALLEGDRSTLKQFHAALNSRREMRALELVGQLHHTRSIQGALQLANAKRQAALAERVAAFLEERLAWEAEQEAAADERGAGAADYGAASVRARAGAGARTNAQGAGGDEEAEEVEEEEEEEDAPSAAGGRGGGGGGAAAKGPWPMEAEAPAAAPRRDGAPAADQRRPLGAGPFARGGNKAPGGGGAAAAAKKSQGSQQSFVSASGAPARGASGANPFARAKKPKA